MFFDIDNSLGNTPLWFTHQTTRYDKIYQHGIKHDIF